MRKIIMTTLIGLLLSASNLIADNKPIDETGIYLNGECKAIASSPDGSTYVLMFDKRLIKIDSDGEQKEIKLPINKEISNLNEYFCDMDVDSRTVYFCGYNHSSIVALDLQNPKELKKLNISYENKPIHPMMISRNHEGWTIKDSEERTFKVDSKGNLTLLPEFSEIILDKSNKAVIKAQPYHDEQGNIIFPGKVLNEDKSVKWTAPVPEFPRVVMGVEYLGYDSDQAREIYLVNNSSGDMDSEIAIYAINKDNKVIAKRNIPCKSLVFIMRYCKLANDGSIIAVYCDPDNPNDRVIIKRFELNQIEVPSKG